MKKKKDEKKPNRRDQLLAQSAQSPPALAQDSGRNMLDENGKLDLVVLNDLLCHLIIQNTIMMASLSKHGLLIMPHGQTPGGIILPGAGGH